jgi:hypothetical protein
MGAAGAAIEQIERLARLGAAGFRAREHARDGATLAGADPLDQFQGRDARLHG